MSSFDDLLIDQVRKYPAIYRFKKNYHRKIVNPLEYMVLKENCWKDIAIELNKTPDECKSRWRNIRDTYRKVAKRNLLGSKYTQDERMKFLDESGDEGENADNSENNKQNTQDFAMNEDSRNSIGGNTQQFILQETNAQGVTNTVVIKTEPNDCLISIDPVYPNVDPNADPNADPNVDPNVPPDAEENTNKKKTNKRKRKAQDIDVGKTHKFFSSMADIVCEFPPHKIAEIRMRICTMVCKMELDILTNQAEIAAQYVEYESSSSM